MINLGIVEDEPIMLASIRECLELSRDVEVILAERSVENFLEEYDTRSTINTMLLDINLPGMSGIDGISKIMEVNPAVDIIMLTNSDDSDNIFKALMAGAVGYISKKKVNPTILRDAVYTVHRGGSYMSPSIARQVVAHYNQQNNRRMSASPEAQLTPRQQEIVQGLVDNLSYKEIAVRLNIGLETVRDHIKNIYRKLQVNSKTEVIRKKLDGEI